MLAVQKTESEDELAAIIAHEMGHILMGHHKDAEVVRAMTDAGSVAAQAFTYASVVSRMDSRKIGKGSYQYYLPDSEQAAVRDDAVHSAAMLVTGVTLLKDVGLAQFDRSQEHKADAFAVEMLLKAGYDPTAMADVLEHIRTAEAEAEKQRLARNGKKTKIKSFDFDSVTDVMINGITGSVSELAQKVKQTHPSAKSRLDRVNKQAAKLLGDSVPAQRETKRHKAAKSASSFRNLASFYQRLHQYIADADNKSSLRKLASMLKGGFGKSATARTMAFASLNTWDPEIAYKLLKGAQNTQSAPIGYYCMLAGAHAQHKNGVDAKKVIARMQRKFPVSSTLPTAITTARTLGDKEWMTASMESCKSQGDKQIRDLCKQASQGRRADEKYRSADGLIGALANSGDDQNRGLAPQASNSKFLGGLLGL
nr:M48 family metalloprotease [Cohaesibacter sp. ES.047]